MTYRSIFMAPDWMHARYLGWQDDWPDARMRVLTQRRAGLRRTLVVSEIDDPAAVAPHWRRITGDTPFDEVCFHDLTGSPAMAEWMHGRGFTQLDARTRMLNVATLAIDLTQDEDALLARMAANTRRNIKRARAAGVVIRADAHHDDALVARFVETFNTMAAERGLQPVNPVTVRAMIAGGHSRLFATFVDGEPGSFLLSYEAAGTALLATSAAAARERDGGGHLLHWEALRAFRASGLRWCDMAGITSTDASDGIAQFKRGFGGDIVDLGREYGRSGIAVRAVRALRDRWRG
jgi:hypothetical protein